MRRKGKRGSRLGHRAARQRRPRSGPSAALRQQRPHVKLPDVRFAIRGADIGGGSARPELGATMTPAKSPWTLDLNLTGFAGKKRGLTGGISVGFMF